jgi:hypothetical protein
MDLVEVLQTLLQNGIEELKLTDLEFGVVMTVSPLTIGISSLMAPLPEEALIKTVGVMPKTYSGKTSDGATFTVTINEGLHVMDKVVLLRCAHGQRYIVLSKVQ